MLGSLCGSHENEAPRGVLLRSSARGVGLQLSSVDVQDGGLGKRGGDWGYVERVFGV